MIKRSYKNCVKEYLKLPYRSNELTASSPWLSLQSSCSGTPLTIICSLPETSIVSMELFRSTSTPPASGSCTATLDSIAIVIEWSRYAALMWCSSNFWVWTKMKIVPTSGWTCARHLAPIDRVHDWLGLLIYFFNDLLFGFIKEMSPHFSHKLQPTYNIYSWHSEKDIWR